MNSSTKGNRFYREDFESAHATWKRWALTAVVIIAMAAALMLIAFLAGAHYGAQRERTQWQARFDVEVARIKSKIIAAGNLVSPKWRCDAAERADFFAACYHRGTSRLKQPKE
jgi:hypothetical protein